MPYSTYFTNSSSLYYCALYRIVHVQVLIRFNELKGRYDKSVKMLNNVLSDPEGSKEIDDELKAIYEAKLSTGYHFMNRDVQSKRCALKTIELVEELQEKNKHSTCELIIVFISKLTLLLL